MYAWECLQLNMQWLQSCSQNAETTLIENKLEIKSLFVLSTVETLPHPAELAKHLMLPKPTITFIIKKLEQAGYLKRKTVKGDLRKFEMVITPSGRNAQEQGQKAVSQALEKSLGKLTSKERDNFIHCLLKMCSGQ